MLGGGAKKGVGMRTQWGGGEGGRDPVLRSRTDLSHFLLEVSGALLPFQTPGHQPDS